MRIEELIEAWRKIIALAKKPDMDDFKQSLKLVLLGFSIVGLLGLVIHLIFTFIRGLM